MTPGDSFRAPHTQAEKSGGSNHAPGLIFSPRPHEPGRAAIDCGPVPGRFAPSHSWRAECFLRLFNPRPSTVRGEHSCSPLTVFLHGQLLLRACVRGRRALGPARWRKAASAGRRAMKEAFVSFLFPPEPSSFFGDGSLRIRCRLMITAEARKWGRSVFTTCPTVVSRRALVSCP